MSNGIAGGDMAGTRGGDNVSIPRFILEDSPKLAKKIQDFEELERRAAEATVTIGDIGEISSIKGQAKEARDEADAELARAKELTELARIECEGLVRDATATAARKISEAEIAAKSMTESAHAEMNEANAAMSEAHRLEQAAKAAQGEADTQAKFLQQKADALVSREQELTGEQSKLAELRDLIQAAL